MVTVPLRAPPVFAGRVMATVPFPLPEAPLETVMNDELLTAVHAHALLALATFTDTVPPVALALTVGEDSVTAQLAGAFGDSWVKLIAVLPIAIDALRAGPWFDATL